MAPSRRRVEFRLAALGIWYCDIRGNVIWVAFYKLASQGHKLLPVANDVQRICVAANCQ